MRRLERPAGAPAKLAQLRPFADAEVLRRLGSGEKLAFRQYVYAADEVRNELDTFHHGKCAYCEADLRPVTNGEVEHFRPKGGYVDELTGKLNTPGYTYLAYEWTNLLLSCSRCNGAANKGNRFPLADETTRAADHPGQLNQEVPLLVNPSVDRPRRHVRFRNGVAYAVFGSYKGTVTREVLGLNDPVLIDARRLHLEIMTSLRAVQHSNLPPADRARARRLLDVMEGPGGPYVACAKDHFHLRTKA